jgi:hypothetical protein
VFSADSDDYQGARTGADTPIDVTFDLVLSQAELDALAANDQFYLVRTRHVGKSITRVYSNPDRPAPTELPGADVNVGFVIEANGANVAEEPDGLDLDKASFQRLDGAFAAAQNSVPLLTQTALQAAVGQATTQWAGRGMDVSLLDNVTFHVGDFTDDALGMQVGNRIVMDADAAGYGWSVGSVSANQVDLVSAVAHEIGHVFGLPDLYDASSAGSIMHGWLAPGGRVEAPFSVAGRDTLFETAFVDLTGHNDSDSPSVQLDSGLTKDAFAWFDAEDEEDETEHGLTVRETPPRYENVDRLFAEDLDNLVDRLMLDG